MPLDAWSTRSFAANTTTAKCASLHQPRRHPDRGERHEQAEQQEHDGERHAHREEQHHGADDHRAGTGAVGPGGKDAISHVEAVPTPASATKNHPPVTEKVLSRTQDAERDGTQTVQRERQRHHAGGHRPQRGSARSRPCSAPPAGGTRQPTGSATGHRRGEAGGRGTGHLGTVGLPRGAPRHVRRRIRRKGPRTTTH